MNSVDIILPAYNPASGWESLVISRFESLQKQLPDFELHLIVVNDGSSSLDEIAAMSRLQPAIPGMRWISYPVNQGKGYALREGVKNANSEMIVYTDIDWPYQEESMIGLIRHLQSADAVIGVRDEGYYKHLPKARQRISKMLRRINALFLRLKVSDTQAGLKGFRRELKPVFLSTTINRYLFDLEFIYRLSRIKNLRITGYHIHLQPGVTFRTMNRKILFQEAKNFLKIWLAS